MNIEHFAINVADPVAVGDWYVRHLGLRILRALGTPPFTRFLADSAGRTVVEIYGHTKAAVPDYRSMDPLVFHIAFSTTDVDTDLQRLLAAGASKAGEINVTPTGDQMTFLRDPWGVALQLVKRAKPLQ
jgi:glyoxylase I family protein